MRRYECTEKRFLESVKDHEMVIARDEGHDRLIRFREPGTNCMWFDILTWGSHLLITGDMGSYLFWRLEDMFRFFRMGEEDKKRASENGGTLAINHTYWAEKCKASGYENIKEYSEESFKKAIKRHFEDYYEGEPKEKKDEIWQEIRWQVLGESENQFTALNAAMRFSYEGNYPFADFWESPCEVYTYHFTWNLYAIVWAIKQYDESKNMVTA